MKELKIVVKNVKNDGLPAEHSKYYIGYLTTLSSGATIHNSDIGWFDPTEKKFFIFEGDKKVYIEQPYSYAEILSLSNFIEYNEIYEKN